jgi:hypothetical protein
LKVPTRIDYGFVCKLSVGRDIAITADNQLPDLWAQVFCDMFDQRFAVPLNKALITACYPSTGAASQNQSCNFVRGSHNGYR